MTPELEALAHEKHRLLGIRSANCKACERRVPEWIRRAQERKLPTKVWA